MTDNELIAMFRPAITEMLTAQGVTADVIQSAQPTIQGASSTNLVFFYKISEQAEGVVGASDTWDEDAQEMVHTETQVYSTTFQAGALCPQTPSSTMTAPDVLRLVRMAIQSPVVLRDLATNHGVGILNIQNIRNTIITNDKNLFEASPSFDFTLTHKQVIITTTPIVETVTARIERV